MNLRFIAVPAILCAVSLAAQSSQALDIPRPHISPPTVNIPRPNVVVPNAAPHVIVPRVGTVPHVSTPNPTVPKVSAPKIPPTANTNNALKGPSSVSPKDKSLSAKDTPISAKEKVLQVDLTKEKAVKAESPSASAAEPTHPPGISNGTSITDANGVTNTFTLRGNQWYLTSNGVTVPINFTPGSNGTYIMNVPGNGVTNNNPCPCIIPANWGSGAGPGAVSGNSGPLSVAPGQPSPPVLSIPTCISNGSCQLRDYIPNVPIDGVSPRQVYDAGNAYVDMVKAAGDILIAPIEKLANQLGQMQQQMIDDPNGEFWPNTPPTGDVPVDQVIPPELNNAMRQDTVNLISDFNSTAGKLANAVLPKDPPASGKSTEDTDDEPAPLYAGTTTSNAVAPYSLQANPAPPSINANPPPTTAEQALTTVPNPPPAPSPSNSASVNSNTVAPYSLQANPAPPSINANPPPTTLGQTLTTLPTLTAPAPAPAPALLTRP